ncbi:hypothetical protein FRB94_012286 [Tulasnella sp. JGI-2019a]|nr:hypothetical protein FRB94_012286 [Tulasnella sp. JGI-2019a]
MESFLGSLQNKAQHALDKSGFASKIPANFQPANFQTHTTAAQQPLNAPGHQGGGKPDSRRNSGSSGRPFIVDNITQQLRALHNQYAPQGPPDVRYVQVLVTNAKGVSLDYQGVGRDAQALSKDFYLWGQEQEEDVKDVTDRLAFVTFAHGNLATNLANELDAARAPFKNLREILTKAAPRKSQLQAIDAQIKTLQTSGGRNPGAETKIAELEAERRRRVNEDEPMEMQIATIKRNAIKESEEIRWKAVKEVRRSPFDLCIL